MADGPAPDYKSMDRDVLAILARNQAKALSEAQGRIDALVQDVATLTGERDRLADQNADLKGQLNAANERVAYFQAFIESDPDAKARMDKAVELEQKIAGAIANHQLAPGMTIEQANKAMDPDAGFRDARLVEQGAGFEVYLWERYQDELVTKSINGSIERGSVYQVPRSRLIATYYAEFAGGVITRTWKSN